MSKRITAKITSNGSFTFTTPLPEFYQGSAYDYYLDIQFEDSLPSGTAVQIMFRRSDGKQTSWLPMNTNNFITYTKKLDDEWYWNKSGDLTFTIQAYKQTNNVLNVIASSYSSFYVNETPAFYEPSPLAPDAYQDIVTNIAENKSDILDLQNSNPVTEIYVEEDYEPEDTTKTQIKYRSFNGSTTTVDIPLPEGLATEEEVNTIVQQGFEDVNPVVQIMEDETKDLSFKYIDFNGNENTVDITIPDDISDKTYVDEKIAEVNNTINQVEANFDGVVRHSALEPIETPTITVSQAEADGEGNNIVDTYVKKSAIYLTGDLNNPVILQNLTSGFYYLSEDTSFVTFAEDVGDVIKTNQGPIWLLINSEANLISLIGNIEIYDGVISNLSASTLFNHILISSSTRFIRYGSQSITKAEVEQNYLSKITNTYSRDRVYSISSDGSQSTIEVEVSDGPDTIARRNGDAQLNIGNPTDGTNAVNLQYLQNNYYNKNKLDNILSNYVATSVNIVIPAGQVVGQPMSTLLSDITTTDKVIKVESVTPNSILTSISGTNWVNLYNPTSNDITIENLRFYFINI